MTTSANPELIRWNEKYRSSVQASHTESPQAKTEFVQPKGEPELVTHLSAQLPSGLRGLALEVACGRGANALYLAQQGYDVIAMDGAEEGLKNCAEAAHHFQLPVHPIVIDLNEVVLPQSHFDMISVVRYLQRDLIPALINAIQPGGLIFYKTFSHHFLKQKPNFNPGYVLQQGELLSWFKGFELLATNADENSGEPTSHFILAKRPES